MPSAGHLNWSHHSEIWGAQSSNILGNAPGMVLHDLSGGQYAGPLKVHMDHEIYYLVTAILTTIDWPYN